MSKLTLTGLALPLFLLFASPPASAPKAFGATKETPESQAQGGTLQKMIIENGSVTMDLDVNQLNGIGSAPGRPTTLQFAVAANSFFPILVFNELLRGAGAGIDGFNSSRGQHFRLQFTCGAACVSQAARNPKASVGRRFRFGRARRQDGIHLFQHRRRPIRLRRKGAVAQHHRRTVAGLQRAREVPWACVTVRRSRGAHLDWRNDATRGDHTARCKR